MADRKISDLTALTAPAAGDYLPIVDISEVAAASKNKRITIEELFRGVPLGTAAAPSIAIEGDENTGIYSPGADQVAISTNGAGRLFVDSSGAVGIGLASDNSAYRLNVYNPSADFCAVSIGNNVSGGGASNGLVIAQNQADALFINRENGYAAFSTNNTERMRITAAGLVGLGTSSPATAFEIQGNQPQITIDTTTTGYTALLFATNGVNDGGIYYNGTDDRMEVYTADTSGNPQAVIDASGRVGIGTTSVGALLHLSAVNPELRIQGTNGTGGVHKLRSSGLNDTDLQFTSAADLYYNATNHVFRTQNEATERARIDSSGRLLVGTSTSVAVNSAGTTFNSELQVAGSSASVTIARTVGSGNLFLARNQTVNDGSPLGFIGFQGGDGTNLIQAASIQGVVDGTPGSNDMPGRIVLSTTADGASSPTERLRITSAGVLQIADAGNISVGTTTGTKIGTATTQKLGFYNATPVVQPTAVADATDAASVITQLNALLTRMRNLGLIAT